MFTPALAVLPVGAKPVCAEPDWLPVVDAAFLMGKAGARARLNLRENACRVCPVAALCLAFAMKNPESGPWGGTGRKARTRRGAPPNANKANLHGVHR